MKSFFKKTPKLGQHLLTSRDIARRVVEAGEVAHGDVVLEIGPGKGMLTKELLAVGARVIAVEKDPEMISVLNETFRDEQLHKILTLYEGDARNFLTSETFSQHVTPPYRIVANIPYYITGELLRLFLTAPIQPQSIALLVQKEVAERITRSKKESILSLSVKAYGTPLYIRTVRAGSFNPPPNVDSAILAISHISRDNFTGISEKKFFELLHVGFGQKRKTLRGNLKRGLGFSEEHLEQVWAETSLDAKVRAEDLPLNTWLTLSKKL